MTYRTSIPEPVAIGFHHNLPARESEAPALCPRLNQSDTPCSGQAISSAGEYPRCSDSKGEEACGPAYLDIGYRLADMSFALMQLTCLVPLSIV